MLVSAQYVCTEHKNLCSVRQVMLSQQVLGFAQSVRRLLILCCVTCNVELGDT